MGDAAIIAAVVAGLLALALVGGVAMVLAHSKDESVSPEWRDAHYRERRNDDG
jgi:hypothetical protein